MAGPAARGMYGVLRPGMEAEDSLLNRTMSGPGQVARNLGGSALAGLLGAPGDLNAMFPKPLQGALPLPTSEQLQDKFGVEANRPESFVGLVGAPDPMDLARAGGKGLLAMTLFHGTPHKFDRFALDKIGTGEGAQAYGHGLYFAENPGVARSYQSGLSGKQLFADGEPVPGAQKWLANSIGSDADIRAIIRRNPEAQETLEPLLGTHREWRDTGHLYKVDIPDEITDRMLDWDAPLSEQPKVMAAIEQIIGRKPPADMTGETAYRAISGQIGDDAFRRSSLGTQEAVSRALNELGIPGIRYFDGDSRTAGEGTRNIVVFNPDDITSVKRDGELVWENRSGIRPD